MKGIDIYNMKLHEKVSLDRHNEIVRVPGGWIYKEWSEDDNGITTTATFVPYSDEFKGR